MNQLAQLENYKNLIDRTSNIQEKMFWAEKLSKLEYLLIQSNERNILAKIAVRKAQADEQVRLAEIAVRQAEAAERVRLAEATERERISLAEIQENLELQRIRANSNNKFLFR
jgi:hypothetical protein